jgi:hypothetical protein
MAILLEPTLPLSTPVTGRMRLSRELINIALWHTYKVSDVSGTITSATCNYGKPHNLGLWRLEHSAIRDSTTKYRAQLVEVGS